MGISFKTNLFTFFKLPSAWWSGVRLEYADKSKALVSVKHNWFNQNPFNSIFWAVLGMAAELSTGVLVATKIKESKKDISMLILNNNGNFTKKAKGKITFRCTEGLKIQEAIQNVVQSGEAQTIWLRSVGRNSEGNEVATFNFEWTLKLRHKK